MEDLPDFEFSDDLENEFAQYKQNQDVNNQSANASVPISQNAAASGQGAATPEEIAKASQGQNGETAFYAWQVCLADAGMSTLSNADDYPNYLINREPITQMLGIGMASGQNAFPVEDAMFVCAISEQVDGEIKLMGSDDPRYKAIAAVVSEELLKNQDRGMVAELPNGNIIAVKMPVDPSSL